ncbi:MAG: type IV pilus assembly protein PilM [Planctomycetes bacterium]|nr:type IV pilus assembly protein PilM [Planctomycetota bacterium]
MASHSIIGLDIGSKWIKALQLSESNGQFRVTEFGALEIPPQYSLADAIAELIGSRRWKTKRVVSSVSGRFVFVRYINMPVMSDEELGNAAKYELGKYIPVEVDEVLHDSQKLEELPPQEGQEPEMRVLLVAAKKTFIEEHIELLRTAGLVPQIIDVDSFAIGNAYELTGIINPQAIRQGKLVALADVGAAKTNINIMSDAMSFFTREFYKGGDDVTDAISKKLGIEPKEAEALKRNPGGDLPRVEECISGVLEDICHDINISIDYFENQYDKKVEEIFITGGSSNCVGMQETLEKTVQKPVSKWNPMQYVEADLSSPDAMQQLTDGGSQIAIALGLASRLRKD